MIIIIIIAAATPFGYDRVEKPLNALYDMHTHFFYTSLWKNLYTKSLEEERSSLYIYYTKIDLYI